MRRQLLAFLTVIAVGVAIMAGGLSRPARSDAATGRDRPTPVIYDSDLDFDDASTLAYLCEEHKLRRIDLRAVTVANDGFGHPQRTLRHARSVLEQCGRTVISPSGRAVRVAFGADTEAFEETFLDALNGRPRLRAYDVPKSGMVIAPSGPRGKPGL